MLRIVSLLISLVFLSNCTYFSSLGKSDIKEDSAESLYDRASEEMDDDKYRRAIEYYEEIERLYPYDALATRAELMRGYAYYKDEAYDDAVLSLERFIKLHPGHEDVAYAYYLIAISYYEQISTVTRDQGNTELAQNALKEVIRRFPQTDYARDAQIKLDLVMDHLAGKELDIGRYYLNQGKYIAAINRFMIVMHDYNTTSHIPEALHRLVEAYTALGITNEAKKYAAVLGYNYPSSKWYKYSYALVGEKEK